MAKAEDEKRKEVADHFQSSIADIQQQLTEYLAKNNDLRQENRSLADKLQSFIKDHEKREEHVQKVGRMWSSFLIFLNPWSWFPLFIFAPQILKTRELEVRLAEAKLSQAKVQQEQEGLKFKQEISRLNEESTLMGKRMVLVLHFMSACILLVALNCDKYLVHLLAAKLCYNSFVDDSDAQICLIFVLYFM